MRSGEGPTQQGREGTQEMGRSGGQVLVLVVPRLLRLSLVLLPTMTPCCPGLPLPLALCPAAGRGRSGWRSRRS